jgi:hypothetical protein
VRILLKHYYIIVGWPTSPQLSISIADLLQDNKTLTKLSFTNCDIQETDCDAIMNALQRNTTLTHLSFAAEKLTSESIGRYLQTNRSLKTLELKKCNIYLQRNVIARANHRNAVDTLLSWGLFVPDVDPLVTAKVENMATRTNK